MVRCNRLPELEVLLVLQVSQHELHEHFIAHEFSDRLFVHFLVILHSFLDSSPILLKQRVLEAVTVVEVQRYFKQPEDRNVASDLCQATEISDWGNRCDVERVVVVVVLDEKTGAVLKSSSVVINIVGIAIREQEHLVLIIGE